MEAVTRGANVINLSLWTVPYNDLQAAIGTAAASAIVVAGAGNKGNHQTVLSPIGSTLPPTTMSSPLRQPTMETASGLTATVGPATTSGLPWPHLASISGIRPQRWARHSLYEQYSGTSFAAPHVAGVAALMYAQNMQLPLQSRLSIDTLRERIKAAAAATPVLDSGGQPDTVSVSTGVVDAYRALTKTSVIDWTPQDITYGQTLQLNAVVKDPRDNSEVPWHLHLHPFIGCKSRCR